jgi:hypothetical protein
MLVTCCGCVRSSKLGRGVVILGICHLLLRTGPTSPFLDAL